MSQSRHRWTRGLFWFSALAVLALLMLSRPDVFRVREAADAPAAPPVRLVFSDGTERLLSDLRVNGIVLNGWASWCAPCRAEVAELNRIHRRWAPRKVLVVGLNLEGLDLAALRSVRDAWGMEYPVAVPATTLTGPLAPSGTIPETWILDRDLRVRARRVGAVTAAELDQVLERLAEEDDARETTLRRSRSAAR